MKSAKPHKTFVVQHRIPNAYGVFNARYGEYGGKKYLFTHRNPATGELWCGDIPLGNNEYGRWVPSEKVKFT